MVQLTGAKYDDHKKEERQPQFIEAKRADTFHRVQYPAACDVSATLRPDTRTSATQLIATATEGAMTRIAGTPFPTLSAEDETALHERFLSEIEGELGFSHPIFEEVVAELIASINQAINYKNEYGFNFHIPETFIRSTDKTTVDGNEYIAVALVSNIEDYF